MLLALGVAPDTKLAREAGLSLGIRDSIAVNEHMETSAPHIYAVGDAVSVENILTHTSALIPLAGPANRQGRVAADNMAGLATSYRGAQGTSILKLFDLTVASTGLNERTAREQGIPFDRAVNFSSSHAAYYPGASNMTIKTLFDPHTGRLLGAQLVGFDGVDKRCDLLAAAIRTGLTGPDLTDLELSYAPPFSSAKDPVNMVGYTIENVLTGLVRQFHWDQVQNLRRNPDVILLDVRTPEEYGRGHIPGARNIPLDDLRDRLKELDPAKPVYVNCQSGLRSYLACRILAQRGFSCFNLAGGYRFYELAAREAHLDPSPAHPCGLKIQ